MLQWSRVSPLKYRYGSDQCFYSLVYETALLGGQMNSPEFARAVATITATVFQGSLRDNCLLPLAGCIAGYNGREFHILGRQLIRYIETFRSDLFFIS